MDAMSNDRQFFSNYLRYVGVIGLALTGIALGLTGAALISIASGLTVAVNPEAEISQPGQTVLDVRMQNLREVQQALAKPLASPEPLTPITARKAHSATRTIGHTVVATGADHRKSMAEARNAFAHIDPNNSDARSSAYAEPDRHGVY
jgi:hypothetical protein